MKSVYCAVRAGSLNKAVCVCATYSINWLVFITEIKSVYSAVRTRSLNKAVCASSLKGLRYTIQTHETASANTHSARDTKMELSGT
jgi:hypothetical protein